MARPTIVAPEAPVSNGRVRKPRQPSAYQVRTLVMKVHSSVPSFDLVSLLDEALPSVIVSLVPGKVVSKGPRAGENAAPHLRLDTKESLPKPRLSEKERLEAQAAKIAARLAAL